MCFTRSGFRLQDPPPSFDESLDTMAAHSLNHVSQGTIVTAPSNNIKTSCTKVFTIADYSTIPDLLLLKPSGEFPHSDSQWRHFNHPQKPLKQFSSTCVDQF